MATTAQHQADGDDSLTAAIPLASTSKGRLSGKAWKPQKTAVVRSQHFQGARRNAWEQRMDKTKKEQAVKKLEAQLKDEKQAEITRRRETTKERKRAAEERQRQEENRAMMGARKAARKRNQAGRSKKING